jgi:hypothetical protein
VTENIQVKKEEEFADGFKPLTPISTSGRIFLNIWRVLRGELNLTSYTLENTVFHVLHQRYSLLLLYLRQSLHCFDHSIPKFLPQTLTKWFDSGYALKWRTLKYFLDRVQYTLRLVDDLSILSKNRYIFRSSIHTSL